MINYKMYFDFSEASLDCHGLRADEVENVVDKFLDKAYLEGKKNVEIIHGFGGGVLKEVISKYLERSPYVENYHPSFASGSMIIVNLK